MDLDFLRDVERGLNPENVKLLREAVSMISKAEPTSINPQVEFDKRLEFPTIPLQRSPVPVIQDENVIFRVLSKSIFGSEDIHDLMRSCIGFQLKKDAYFYGITIFGSVENCRAEYEKILSGKSAGGYYCVVVCAHLFQVRFRLVDVAADIAIQEYSHFKPKAIFWISTSADPSGWNTLFPRGKGPALPCEERVKSLYKRFRDYDEDELISECEGFVRVVDEFPVAEDEHDRLNFRTTELGCEKVPMTGDGNCMLRALSYMIFGDQDRYKLMRYLIIQKLRSRPDRYMPFCYLKPQEGPSDVFEGDKLREQWEHYLRRLSKNYEWAGRDFIQAALDMFGLKLTSVHSEEELVMKEMYPESGVYYATIFACFTSSHMDALLKNILSQCCPQLTWPF